MFGGLRELLPEARDQLHDGGVGRAAVGERVRESGQVVVGADAVRGLPEVGEELAARRLRLVNPLQSAHKLAMRTTRLYAECVPCTELYLFENQSQRSWSTSCAVLSSTRTLSFLRTRVSSALSERDAAASNARSVSFTSCSESLLAPSSSACSQTRPSLRSSICTPHDASRADQVVYHHIH